VIPHLFVIPCAFVCEYPPLTPCPSILGRAGRSFAWKMVFRCRFRYRFAYRSLANWRRLVRVWYPILDFRTVRPTAWDILNTEAPILPLFSRFDRACSRALERWRSVWQYISELGKLLKKVTRCVTITVIFFKK